MTDVLLEIEYENAKEAIRRYLLAEYDPVEISSELIPHTKGIWRNVWEIILSSQSGEHKIWLAIPHTFPDQLPSIFLPSGNSYRIPHLNNEKQLCTFDKSEAQPNSDLPVGIIKRLIEKAKKIIDDGLLNRNNQEYIQEFEAYWEDDANVKSFSIVNIIDKTKRIYGIRLEPAWSDFKMLFADSVQEGKKWLSNVGANFKKDAESILYLPIDDFGFPPYPTTNSEIYQRLKKCDPNALSVLSNYLSQSTRPAGVLFALNVNQSSRVLGAWWHQKNYHQVFKGREGIKFYSNVAPGFSKKKLSVKHELSAVFGSTKVIKSRVERADSERIFTRTIGSKPKAFSEAVNLIGCGSVGSNIAVRLADSGAINKLRLIDPETIKIENIARHYCGMSYINQSKSYAVANKLMGHYPHLQCEQYDINALELLRGRSYKLIPADLTIVAVAELAVERRINKISIFSDDFRFPHCYVWVEPHLVGGHAVFVQSGEACLECAFDQNFSFKYKVITNAENFSMREAGCRSGFTPYGMLDLMEFTSALTRFLLNAKRENKSQVFTWLGNLELARQMNIEIEPRWQNSISFSTKITTLNKNPSCYCSFL